MNKDQRRELLRGAKDETDRVRREYGWNSPQARAAHQSCLVLERSTAAELGLPYAERVELGVTWDIGAPMPVVLSGLRTFVVFYLSAEVQADPGVGIVEFKRVASVKIGSPNDEALGGHPLWGSGLELYVAHEVRNSPWIAELMDVNRVHPGFDERIWRGKRHFVLTFHDETLECIANRTITRSAPGATLAEALAWLSTETL